MSGGGTAALLLGLALLAGCAGGGHPSADAVTEATCRARADQVYQMRHPEEVYSQDTYTSSLRDAPFATNGSPSLPTKGLSGAYERQEMVADCLRGTGGSGGIGPTPAPPPVAGPGGAP